MLYYLLQPFGVLMVLYGLASCFFGYEIYKAFIRVTGFFIGVIISLVLAVFLRTGTEISIILALFFGVLGAILAVPLNSPLHPSNENLHGVFIKKPT
jgi:hypothetical protein